MGLEFLGRRYSIRLRDMDSGGWWFKSPIGSGPVITERLFEAARFDTVGEAIAGFTAWRAAPLTPTIHTRRISIQPVYVARHSGDDIHGQRFMDLHVLLPGEALQLRHIAHRASDDADLLDMAIRLTHDALDRM